MGALALGNYYAYNSNDHVFARILSKERQKSSLKLFGFGEM